MQAASDIAFHHSNVVARMAHRDLVFGSHGASSIADGIVNQSLSVQAWTDGIVALRPLGVSRTGLMLFVNRIQKQRSAHTVNSYSHAPSARTGKVTEVQMSVTPLFGYGGSDCSCACRLALADAPDVSADVGQARSYAELSGCHNPENPKNRLDFLKASDGRRYESAGGDSGAVSLSSCEIRTMPPAASKLTEDDRLRISSWIDDRLRQTACSTGDFAGGVTIRRLNRREYRNTVRDLLGRRVAGLQRSSRRTARAAKDSTRMAEHSVRSSANDGALSGSRAAGLDRAIITPAFNKNFGAFTMEPLAAPGNRTRSLGAGEALATTFSTFADGDYNIRVWIDRPKDRERFMLLTVNGNPAGKLIYQRDPAGGPTARA